MLNNNLLYDSAAVGIPAGIVCAIRRGGVIDQMVSLFANIGIAIPIFWLGIMAIYLSAYQLGWLPIQGWTSPLQDFVKSSKQALRPVIE